MVSYRQCTADEVGVSARFKALEANGLTRDASTTSGRDERAARWDAFNAGR